METLLQDIRYGFRTLIKNPGFTMVAVFALALGIGANTAIFSVVNVVLLRQLPYENPDRLVTIWENKLTGDATRGQDSPVTFADWRDQKQIFEGATGWWYPQINLTKAGAEPERVRTIDATDDFFTVMGARPILGRTFLPGEDRPGQPRIAVISAGLWQRRFGSDPDVVGKQIALDEVQHTIVGVMPADFRYPNNTDVWRPLGWTVTQHSRGAHFFEATARLKPGITLERAQADLNSLAVRIAQDNPRTNTGWGVTIVPLREQLVGNYKTALLVLLGAVGFVLLIACTNVANLLLARAGAREKEFSIRVALGAGRIRLIRQLLTESLMLALLGGALGLLLAVFGGNLLMAVNPFKIPLLEKLIIDVKILGFTMAVALLTGLLFGLVPALHATKSDLNSTLKEGGRESKGAKTRLRNVLVVAEIAITLVLLIGAGLMLKSFIGLQRIDPGFNSSNVLTFNLQLPGVKYTDWRQVAGFYSQLTQRLKNVPGIRSADVTSYMPLESGYRIPFVNPEHPAAPDGEQLMAQYRMVGYDYFKTMGIPLLQGRMFTEYDLADSQPVVMINQALKRRYWPNEDPTGRHLLSTGRRIGPLAAYIPASLDCEIIGIVGDEKNAGLNTAAEPALYFPQTQFACRSMSVVVRTTGDPAGFANAMRNEVWALDNNMPVSDLQTMDQVMSTTVAQPMFSLLLLAIFALLALLLASVGIYGVMAYSVSQRTQEIGIRMALGAQQSSVLAMVMGQGMKLAGIGIALGIVGALLLTNVLKSLLYNVSATDPFTFVMISLVLTIVASLACYLPARRATLVDPLVALRMD